jgi:hypothetical protein
MVGTSRRGKDRRKRDQRVNVVEIFCTYICKQKNETVEISENKGK